MRLLRHALAAFLMVLPLNAQVVPRNPADGARSHRQVTFAFDRKGLPVPRYTLTIRDDGSGTYKGEEVIVGAGPYAGVNSAPQDFDRRIRVSEATASRIFELAGELDGFRKVCASKARNVADTGTKVLSYSGPDGSGSCTYNFSEIKSVVALTYLFEGIAETMDRGRQLNQLRRYDRLGLDEAMTFLTQEVSQGRALELGNIQATLLAISTDADVIERVRTKAGLLLALIPAETSRDGDHK